MSVEYAVSVHREDGDHVVSVRDLPEVVTSGSTLDEALLLAGDAVAVAVAGRMEDDMDLPDPSPCRGDEYTMALPAALSAKAAVYRAFKASGLKKVDLARQMGRNEVEVRRILDPHHGTKLGQLDEAARALGGRLSVAFEPG